MGGAVRDFCANGQKVVTEGRTAIEREACIQSLRPGPHVSFPSFLCIHIGLWQTVFSSIFLLMLLLSFANVMFL